ncbi:19901_t:CDS:2, partial [Gigaspora margarita]
KRKSAAQRRIQTCIKEETFKNACNIRSPQDHVGIVHCSNLCTEITLNTSETETAKPLQPL